MIVKARFIGNKPKGRYYPGKVYELEFKTVAARVPFTTTVQGIIHVDPAKDLEGDRIPYETILGFLKDWNVISG